jgi:four helix bundle protein
MRNLKSKFVALEVSLELTEILGPTLITLKRRNKDLADQAKRALQSVALNLAEGSRSQGGNRTRAFWIAAGNLEELLTALRVAVNFGEIDESTTAQAGPLLERLRGLVWGLTHPSK